MKNYLLLILGLLMAGATFGQAMNKTIYPFTMTSIDGEKVSLSDFEGKVVVLVNVASECGLTPQYKDLQATYDKYKDQGLVILGFPANNFGAQEPGSDAQIQQFCTKNFGVTFPMFSKISVKGDDMHPLYQWLTQKDQNGLEDSEVQWNFQKYMVNRKGELVRVVSPRNSVAEADIDQLIQTLLAE